jgi:hypothetical protein
MSPNFSHRSCKESDGCPCNVQSETCLGEVVALVYLSRSRGDLALSKLIDSIPELLIIGKFRKMLLLFWTHRHSHLLLLLGQA